MYGRVLSIGLLALLLAAPARAQVRLEPPTDRAVFAWQHSGANVERFEVRLRSADPWQSVGRPSGNQVALPALTDGSYNAEVRACNTGGCSTPYGVPFIVQTPVVAPGPVTGASVTVPQAPPPPPPPPPSDPPPSNPPPTEPSSGALFFSGWRDLGCESSTAVLLDRGLWGDFGPAWPGACGIAQVVDVDGVRALQVTQMPGNQNGSDFRIERNIGTQQEVTVIYRIKFAPNFRFATGDHKMLILGGGGGQNVYVNVRGTAGNPTQGRITVHVIPVDTAMSDRNVPITVGEWHELRVNVRAGAGGYVRVKLDGQLLTLVTEAGNQANPNNLNTGVISFVKPDTTYNIGSAITEPMNVYYDFVAVHQGNAIF